MGLLEKIISGAIGYGISEVLKSHVTNRQYDRRISVEDIIDRLINKESII
jgi:hypothetical protein